jgi:hypothetical protein
MSEKKKKNDESSDDPAVIIAFLLDETGSMESVRQATISGFNEYIQTVNNEHPDALLSLVLFSTVKYDGVYRLTPLPVVAPLTHNTYRPNGGTPLYDCIARLIGETENAIASIKPTPEVLFVIMTDGEENSSREYNRARIVELITQKEAAGWSFVYLGANQDAWQVGASIGVKASHAMTYDHNPVGTAAAFGIMAGATSSHFERRKAQRREQPNLDPAQLQDDAEFFTDEDAKKLGKQKPSKPGRA